ncbi:MAG: hypothetical protein WC873_02050 [Candidatus Gracilibacteria bacterium]
MFTKIKTKITAGRLRKAQEREATSKAGKATDSSAFDNAIIVWQTPEIIRYQRGNVWSVVMALLVLGLAAIGYFYNAWTFSLVIIVFALVYMLISREKPKIVTVKLSPIGIKVGTRQYPYSQIKHFFLLYQPPFLENLVIRQNGFTVDVNIPLNGNDPATVREFLKTKITEKEGEKEPITDTLIRLFKL